MIENPNIVPFQDPASCFDLRWMFGAQIGKDTTSNFALSFNGLAVRTIDNRFVVPGFKGNTATLTDVTCLTINVDPCVWRIPVAFEKVKPGDLLVRSDMPFSLLFVQESKEQERRLHVIDPMTDQAVDIVVPDRTLEVPSFLVRIVSLYDVFDADDFKGGEGEGEGKGAGDSFNTLLPLLLSSCGGNTGGNLLNNNILLAMLLSRGGSGIKNLAPLLLLCSGTQSSSGLQALLLASVFSGGKFLGAARGRTPQEKKSQT
jgi:hypothetical protein